MKTIKIAGVPEHFNLPWHMCIEDGEFEFEGKVQKINPFKQSSVAKEFGINITTPGDHPR